MLFITNANGDALNFIPSQVYQGSNEASEIIFLSPITAGVVECTFTLPDGTRTTPVILRALVEQGTFDVVKDGVTFQFRMWRAVLPRSVTQVAGAVQAQFTISNGTQTIATASFSFNVVFGAGQIRPDPPAQDVYEAIVDALGEADTRLDAVELLTATLRTDLSNETTAREEADTALNGRLTSVEGGLADETTERESADAALNARVAGVEGGLSAETSARESADTALDARLGDVEAGLADKVDKAKGVGRLSAYCVNAWGDDIIVGVDDNTSRPSDIVRRDRYGRIDVQDAATEYNAVNLRTQTAAIDAAKAEAKEYTDFRFSQFDLVVVVSELPETGEENKLYLLTKENGESGDLFEEYLWVNGAWERHGSARLDLSGYATTEALESGLAGKAAKIDNTTNDYRLVGVDPDGNYILYKPNDSSPEPMTIARRDINGRLFVGTPTENGNATTKKYVDDGLSAKLTRRTTNAGVIFYTEQASGTVMLDGQYGAVSESVALRGVNGALAVGNPTEDNHATPKKYVDEKFSQFDIITIVSELPATGEPNRLYLVTKTGGTSGDLFDEYVWENGAWERVGSASIDLSGYATTEALTEGLAGKLDKNMGYDYLYSIYGVDRSGNQIMYLVSGDAKSGTIAWRGATGALAVGNPTTASHATPRSYVDEKCVAYDISLESEAWVERPVSGPPGEDDAWRINLSDVGIIDNPKFIAWTFHNEGYASVPTGFESANGTNAYPNGQTSSYGAKVQIAEGELIILGATSPSSTSFGVRYIKLVVFY